MVRFPVNMSEKFQLLLAKYVIIATIQVIILSYFLMFYQLFSPQVKRRVIISNKHGIYELPHELPNDLRLKILQN